MRRKALRYIGKLNNSAKESYEKSSPTAKEMINFEEDLRLM